MGNKKRQTFTQTFPLSFITSVSAPVQAVSAQLSSDGRRRKDKAVAAEPPTPPRKKRKLSSAHPPPTNQSLYEPEPDPDLVDINLAGPPIEKGRSAKGRRKKAYSSDLPLQEFKTLADDYARALLWTEGRGDEAERGCPGCASTEKGHPEYRCSTCFGGGLYCRSCCVESHAQRPFCRIERWTGTHFEDVRLVDLGHVIQVGHPEGERCPAPRRGNVDFTIIHVNGLHKVAVDFCGCQSHSEAVPYREQLLRSRLIPATVHDPQTCCTFEVLHLFHLLTFNAKTTAYDFYASLERLTDNPGTRGLQNRYNSFLRCVRIWRYLTRLKQAGRANDTIRAPSNVLPGELALPCPACPRPGVNLPDNWQDAPAEKRYLYVLFIALDACFRLKRRKISTRERDPSLADGGAYMVESAPFEEYLKNVEDQTDVSTCTGLAAVDHANTKFSKGYAETGKMMGLCARHEFVQRNGIVPTQVGERYANTDYALGSLLRHHSSALRLVLSYDICCQYSKRFKERLSKLPPLIRFKLAFSAVRFVIPKLHIHGHRLACQLLFSLNWMWGVGRTDGEGVERPWSFLGALCTSLRMMGPGSAADTLDDHFGHWNWMKLVGLGLLLRRRLIDALGELMQQRKELEEFKRGQQGREKAWEAEVNKFEQDSSQPNPFELPKTGANESDVALELANEEAEEARRGLEFGHDMAPSAFLLALLDIENDQRNLRLEVAGKKFISATQQGDLARRRTKLTRSINKLNEVQAHYTPDALPRTSTWKADPTNVDKPVEDAPLFPPSALATSERRRCFRGVVRQEARLRDAQCRTALDTMRNLLIVHSRLLTYKNLHVRHQGPNTRAQASLTKNMEKIKRQAHKYVAAHTALVNLADGNAAKVPWHALDINKDVRCMEDGDDGKRRGRKRASDDAEGAEDVEAGEGTAGSRTHLQQCRDATGEGRRKISWIWKGVDTTNPDQSALYAGIKVEYCKAYARKRRWEEEVPLLREEMRRTLVSLAVDSARWERIANEEHRSGPLGEGARAYAYSQADTFRRLHTHFDALWHDLKDDREVSEGRVQELRAAEDAAEDAEVEAVEGGDELESNEDDDLDVDDGEDGDEITAF
ncbi:hypothetical protein EV715DRAFT_295467 [Schizophyllum commune]